jgi:hypothetical protein
MRHIRKRNGISISAAMSDTGLQPGQRGWIQTAHADSGLRRNRSSKTRKGRERNLEPGRKLSLGRAEGTGTDLGEARFQLSGWLACRTRIGPKGRSRSLPVSTGELDQ